MTYWDSIVAIFGGLTSPVAVTLYLLIAVFGTVMACITALIESGFRYRTPVWCKIVWAGALPVILLLIAAIHWVASVADTSKNTWP